MAADRRDKARREATDHRVTEGRVLTALAVLARKGPATWHELALSPVLRGVAAAALDAALRDLAAHGRIAVELSPDPTLPLIAPAIVRYRPLALASGSSLTKGGA